MHSAGTLIQFENWLDLNIFFPKWMLSKIHILMYTNIYNQKIHEATKLVHDPKNLVEIFIGVKCWTDWYSPQFSWEILHEDFCHITHQTLNFSGYLIMI